jgi:hypothetical protein
MKSAVTASKALLFQLVAGFVGVQSGGRSSKTTTRGYGYHGAQRTKSAPRSCIATLYEPNGPPPLRCAAGSRVRKGSQQSTSTVAAVEAVIAAGAPQSTVTLKLLSARAAVTATWLAPLAAISSRSSRIALRATSPIFVMPARKACMHAPHHAGRVLFLFVPGLMG